MDCMGAIRILPDHLVNKIAAGEVIERPAAAVKELVENSLDAGASRVEVEVRKSGKNLIRVRDDGCGMSPDDALTALERHATSKIHEAGDLLNLRTFGFRGEALSSIAAVSRFTLRTRPAESPQGTEIRVNGGRLARRRECGMAPGTEIEAAALFYSVPARRKFLKTDRTEGAHISRLVRLLAIAHPEVAFVLTEDGREHFRSPVCPDLCGRVGEVFGRKTAAELMETEAVDGNWRLSGLIGRPGASRSTRQEMITYVNRRPVENRALLYALIEACHTFLPKGRYPLAFLFLEMPPEDVDVNVHPTKREVRFKDEGRARRFVIQTVLQRLREETESARNRASTAAPDRPKGKSAPSGAAMPPPSPENQPAKRQAAEMLKERTSPQKTPPRAAPPEKSAAARLAWRCMGLAHGVHAVFETEAGLVLLRPRRAVERITYERIRGRLTNPAGQPLLFPAPLELDPVDSAALTEHLEVFQKCGFQIEEFGRHFFRIEAIPDWLEPGEAEEFARDLTALIRERGWRPDMAHEEVARLAAARAAKTEPPSDLAALNELAGDLMRCENPLADPRGRPVFFEIPKTEMERKFG